jgi:hypothetical protein
MIKSVTVELSGQDIQGVVIHDGPDSHDRAVRFAIERAIEHATDKSEAKSNEIWDAVRRDAYYAEGDWSISVVQANENPHPLVTSLADRRMDTERRKIIEDIYANSDLLGYTVESADGWEHDGRNTYSRNIYVLGKNDGDPTVKHRLVIVFRENDNYLNDVTIDGQKV